jgi:hypothetical protein
MTSSKLWCGGKVSCDVVEDIELQASKLYMASGARRT